MRSNAPRLSDVLSLSVTIVNDLSTRSDNRRTSSQEHIDTSSSSERKRRKRSSSDVDQRQHSRSTEKSKLPPENTSKTKDLPWDKGKKSRPAGVEKDTDSDDLLTVVAVQKRLSRAKTVRMYRSVKLYGRDEADDSESSDDEDDETSRPTTEKKHKSTAAVNGVSKKKTPSGRERKRSSKQALSVGGRNDSRKTSTGSGNGSRGVQSKHHDIDRGDSRQSAESASSKSSHIKRHKTSL